MGILWLGTDKYHSLKIFHKFPFSKEISLNTKASFLDLFVAQMDHVQFMPVHPKMPFWSHR